MNSELREFIEKLIPRLKEHYGEEYCVKHNEVTKNNGHVRNAIVIQKEGDNVTPNIYIDELFDDYLQGETFADIVREIIKIRDDNDITDKIDIDFLHDYSKVIDKLGVKLVNRDRNEELLKDVPYKTFSDLVILFFISISNDAIGDGTILINNSIFKDWNITLDQLYEDAINNMTFKYPPERSHIIDTLIEMYAKKHNADTSCLKEAINDWISFVRSVDYSDRRMYVLTNTSKWLGASVICYKGMLKELGDYFESDYFILPSSIHEVILVPYEDNFERYEFNDMVHEINMAEVGAEELLSDHAYRYIRESDELIALI